MNFVIHELHLRKAVTFKTDYNKSNRIISVEDAEKLEPSYIAVESIKWCSCVGKVWQYFKRLNREQFHS